MQTKNPLFNDFAKLVTGAFGIAQNAKSELETVVSSMIERWLSERDLVNREEFDAVRIMVENTAAENDKLLKIISRLEAKLERQQSKNPKKT